MSAVEFEENITTINSRLETYIMYPIFCYIALLNSSNCYYNTPM